MTPARAPAFVRAYDAPLAVLQRTLKPSDPFDDRMRALVDALWDAFHAQGVSWVGYYALDPHAPADRALTLGPRRDKPACSPIGLHGACGQCVRAGRAFVVRDVADLGPHYVACDPRDRSEVVVPVFEGLGPQRRCVGCLDLDSFEVGAFTDADAAGLRTLLRAAGFGTE